MDNYKDSLYRMFMSGSHIFSAAKSKKPDSILRQLNLDANKTQISQKEIIITKARPG